MRMRPQQPVQPDFRSVSMVLPSALPQRLPGQRMASASGDVVYVDAANYEQSLDNNRIELKGEYMVLRPVYHDSFYDNIAEVAYATFRADLQGYSGDNTIGFEWAENGGPHIEGKYWVGLSNWGQQRWDWFRGPRDNVLTVPDLAAYQDAFGETLIMVATTGRENVLVLRRMGIGLPEQRGTGYVPDFENAPPVTPPLFDASRPASVDLSADCAPVGDQGTWGSCTAFAVGNGAYNYELGFLYGSLGWDLTDPAQQVSPKFLYIESGRWQGFPPSGDFGRYTDLVAYGLSQHGIASEANAPYDLIYEENWSAEALADAQLLKSDGYFHVPCTSASGLASIKHVLANLRHPVFVSTQVDYGFLDYQAGDVWSYKGPSIGGHAMLIVGYDDAMEAFKVRNSWSEDWGDSGYLWMSYDSFTNPYNYYIECGFMTDSYDAAVVEHFLGNVSGLLPPQKVQASDGVGTTVELSWEAAAGASGYKIYRDSLGSELLSLGAVTSWVDESADDEFAHAYWVVSTNGAQESVLSNVDIGFTAKAPSIEGVSPEGGSEGQLVHFVPEAYGTAGASFSWDFGGGAVPNTSSLSVPEVALGTEGNYSCTLTITGPAGSDSFPFTLEVKPNEAPVYNPLPINPSSGVTSLQVNFDASGARDWDGFIVLYEWDFDGDGSYDEVNTLPTAQHTYGIGVFQPVCRIMDDGGLYCVEGLGTITVTETVPDNPPTADFFLNLHGKTQPPLLVDFTEAAEDDNGVTLYEWDLDGNGSFELSGANLTNPSYTYTEHGTYNLTLRVTDISNQQATDTSTISVGIGETVAGWDLHRIKWLHNQASGRISAALVDGKPCFALINDKGALWYYSALNALPASETDWSSLQLEADFTVGTGVYPGLIECAGQPAVAFFSTAQGKLAYKRFDGSSWVLSNPALPGTHYPQTMSLALIGSKPAMVSSTSNVSDTESIFYLRSGTDTPALNSDWTAQLTYAQEELEIRSISLAEIGGKPAYYAQGRIIGVNAGQQYYGRSGIAEPTMLSDWSLHQPSSTEVPTYVGDLISLGGRPLVFHPSNSGQAGANVLWATVAEPAQGSDWTAMLTGSSDQDMTQASLCSIAGVPYCFYKPGQYATRSLYLAQADDSNPQADSDWSTEALWHTQACSVELLDIAGKPALIFMESGSGSLYFAYPTP
ncbi:hypothetical protein IT575_14020 [bacterium]|nr:hypothetical protein [bacterium]